MRRAGTTAVAVAVTITVTMAALTMAAAVTVARPGTAAAGVRHAAQPETAGPLVDPPQPAERLRLKKRLAREKTVRGDEDRGVRAIEHVTELQYRLRRANVYRGPVTGYFGDLTRAAVKRFQRRAHLPVSGDATGRTWRVLLPRTVANRDAAPRGCTRGHGWHACYDRSRHQLMLWKGGRLWNTWLVRGGDRGSKTRTGRFRVFYRDRDHVSGIYGTKMPFSQFFSGGQAFHGSPAMMDPYEGHSAGCVNMYWEDARQLWRLTHRDRLTVHVYGRWS